MGIEILMKGSEVILSVLSCEFEGGYGAHSMESLPRFHSCNELMFCYFQVFQDIR